MAPPKRGEARRRHGRRLLLLTFVSLGVFLLTAVALAAEPTIEPDEAASGFVWKPSAVTTTAGGSVAFRNPGAVTPHGVHWTGGPDKPSCSGIPVDNFGTNWSGACTFAQAGTYTFVCTVHPEEMKGTITVAAGETSPPPPPAPGQAPAPSEGPAVGALSLAKNQQGGAVRGSIVFTSAAVGGHLTVEVQARRASLGGQDKGLVQVGKLNRSIAGAGPLPFAVGLKAFAQRAVLRRGRLPLIVKTVVTLPNGLPTTMTRRVKLSG
jgi:plastocyanin